MRPATATTRLSARPPTLVVVAAGLVLLLAGEVANGQRLLGLVASAGLMRALRNRGVVGGESHHLKDSPSPLNQHPTDPLAAVAAGYPGGQPHHALPYHHRAAAVPPSYNAYPAYGSSYGSQPGPALVSSLEGGGLPFGAPPAAAAASSSPYGGYGNFMSSFAGGGGPSPFGGYPGGPVGFAAANPVASPFQGYALTNTEQLASASNSQSSYHNAPRSAAPFGASPFATSSGKGFSAPLTNSPYHKSS